MSGWYSYQVIAMCVLSTKLLTDVVEALSYAKKHIRQSTTIPQRLPDLWRVSLATTLVKGFFVHPAGWA